MFDKVWQERIIFAWVLIVAILAMMILFKMDTNANINRLETGMGEMRKCVDILRVDVTLMQEDMGVIDYD